MKWTLIEALTKTSSKILQKFVGVVSSTMSHVFFATMVVGLVQVIGGFSMARKRKTPLLCDQAEVIGSCAFGFFAVVASALSFSVFLYGGEIGVNTFIITLSIIPGALIDRIFFGKRLMKRQWLGIVVGILAAYSILDWPSLSAFADMPLWVWLSFGITMSVAINQGITQKIKKVDMFVKNFWGGLTTVVLASSAIFALGSAGLFVDFSSQMGKLWGVSALVGLIVIAMWSVNLLAYKDGASIAIKKLLMNGSYLTMTMIAGILFFGEALTLGKVVGVVLFFAAFSLMDNAIWNYFVSRFRPSS